MKCPYLSPGIEQVNQNFYIYDSDGKKTPRMFIGCTRYGR